MRAESQCARPASWESDPLPRIVSSFVRTSLPCQARLPPGSSHGVDLFGVASATAPPDVQEFGGIRLPAARRHTNTFRLKGRSSSDDGAESGLHSGVAPVPRSPQGGFSSLAGQPCCMIVATAPTIRSRSHVGLPCQCHCSLSNLPRTSRISPCTGIRAGAGRSCRSFHPRGRVMAHTTTRNLLGNKPGRIPTSTSLGKAEVRSAHDSGNGGRWRGFRSTLTARMQSGTGISGEYRSLIRRAAAVAAYSRRA